MSASTVGKTEYISDGSGRNHPCVHGGLTSNTTGLTTTGVSGEGFASVPTPKFADASRIRLDGKFFAKGTDRWRLRGVTYGPFGLNSHAEAFPSPDQTADDFARMRHIGVNSIRTYHIPPEWLLNLADEHELGVFIDVPWAKHVCFLDSGGAQADARRAVEEASRLGSAHPCVLAYSIGNEVPPNIVRWHGARRVQRFLGELADVARQADPESLVTYANFPSTEYLDLSFLDFVTFNVYLHERETFRRYLLRLLNMTSDKPLVLGELGMDTLRHGQQQQADFLRGHLAEATLLGVAGTFVFSWTDDWTTGGFPIDDWAFGITGADRAPKAAYHALGSVHQASPAELLLDRPRVSVVVCTYNGGRTLDQCVRSLLKLNYPDYELIVVDDGSTDDTRAILARYPEVKAIYQENCGLSAARNAALKAATGAIIAYTDSDCFVDRDWLAHLVHHFERSGAAAVGGPNLTPEDGWLAACVAAAPGQPMHVLESDQVAEHIPGCNMAFRRGALEAINGFDPQFRKAGDDVDVCWRLQQAGYWISFAPGAVVWHHRRQTIRAYLRQQAGYGEAEALLRFKHPDKFNNRGDGKWRGILYGHSLQGLRLDQAIIYRGTFGTGLFQCIYQPGPAHWAMLPGTLEWHALAGLLAVSALFWPPAWLGVGLMLALTVAIVILQGVQARLAPRHESWLARGLVSALCYLQPLVRSWHRYRTRLFAYRPPRTDPAFRPGRGNRLSFLGRKDAAYWSEDSHNRTDLLGLLIVFLSENGWGKTVDSGWEHWDLEIYCHPGTILRVYTAQEDHGQGKRLLRVRYRLRTRPLAKLLVAGALLLSGVSLAFDTWPVALGTVASLLAFLGIWWRGSALARKVVSAVDGLARHLGLLPSQSGG